MGTYVYKLTSQRVRCTDGQEANVAVFAYKPSWSDDRANRRMHFLYASSGDRLADAGKLTGRVITAYRDERTRSVYIDRGASVFLLDPAIGTFYDDAKRVYLPGVTVDDRDANPAPSSSGV